MKVRTIKTHRISPGVIKLNNFLDTYVRTLKEGSILAITSKVVSILEGRVLPLNAKTDKMDLIKKEAEKWLPSARDPKGVGPTIKFNIFNFSAGIDESNSGGYYVLWPKNPQLTANKVREYLRKKYKLKKVGVIITDSRIIPLRWGTIGVALAHSGFNSMKNYIGKKDAFGKTLKISISNIADALAISAVLQMGEGNEQTPLAVIEDIPFVEFKRSDPTRSELNKLHVGLKDPMFKPIFKNVKWKKGGSGR